VEELLRALKNGHHVESEAALQLFHVAEFELWHDIHHSRVPCSLSDDG